MAITMPKKIPLSGVPIAWLYEITIGEGTAANSIDRVYDIDNLGGGQVNYIASASAGGNDNNVDINRNDGTIIRFPNDAPIVGGPDELEIVDESGGTDASGLGTIQLILNEAPIQSTSITAFISELEAKKNSKFLIIVPTIYTYDRLGTGATKKPDGFVYMIGKRTNDLSLNLDNNPKQITLEFAAQKATDLNADDIVDLFPMTGIAIKRGGSDIAASVNAPIDLVTDDADALLLGKVVTKENS
jgi:hypothetical protein